MKKVYIKMPVKVHSANKSATEDVLIGFPPLLTI